MGFRLKINKKRFESKESKIKGQDLLKIADLDESIDYEILYKVNEKGYEPIQLDEVVDLTTPGIEGFFIKPYRRMVIKVDDKEYQVEELIMTPMEIMELAGISPDIYYLKEFRKGGNEVSYKDDAEHKIAIKRGAHFVSCQREDITCVIVNAREKAWNSERISYEDVVNLAYANAPSNANIIYTIVYKNGVPSMPEGSLSKGAVIYVKNKMIFNVVPSNKS